jgi:hypothetical protein
MIARCPDCGQMHDTAPCEAGGWLCDCCAAIQAAPTGPPNVRADDYETSREAGEAVDRRGQARALLAYYADALDGLTQSEVGALSGLAGTGACYWHRVGDARAWGWLEWQRTDDGKIVKRTGDNGRGQGVSIITPLGLKIAGS